MRRLCLFVAVVSAGCLRSTAYKCSTDDQCGAGGACEITGYCSVADSACDGQGGRRYAEHSGLYANKCTGAVNVGGDVGPDTPVVDDVMPDTPTTNNCPGAFAALGTFPHRYRVISTPDAWMNQSTACSTGGANRYLAIPDDQAELTAITVAANATIWVGVEDAAPDDDMFVTVKGVAYPTNNGLWASGEPDDAAESGGPNNAECVQATTGNSGKLSDDRCSEQYVAVCECEP